MENNSNLPEESVTDTTSRLSTPTSESPPYTVEVWSKEAWRAGLKTGDSTSIECRSFATYESASTQPPGVFAGTSQPSSPGAYFATLRASHSRTSTPLQGTWSPILDRDGAHTHSINELLDAANTRGVAEVGHPPVESVIVKESKEDEPAKQESASRNPEQRNSGILQGIWSASSAWIGSLNTELSTKRRSLQDLTTVMSKSAPVTPSPTKTRFAQSDPEVPPPRLLQNLWKRSSAWMGTHKVDSETDYGAVHQEHHPTMPSESNVALDTSPIRGGFKLSVLVDDPRAILVELQQILMNQLMELTEAYCKYNPDGYDMHLINRTRKALICMPAHVTHAFHGSFQTSSEILHERLHDVLTYYLDVLDAAHDMATPSQFVNWKPLIIIALIRDAPTRSLFTVVENAYRRLGPTMSSQIRITFVQIGDEEKLSRAIRQFDTLIDQSNLQRFVSICLPSSASHLPEALIRCFIKMAEPYPSPQWIHHFHSSPSHVEDARRNPSADAPATLTNQAEGQSEDKELNNAENSARTGEENTGISKPNLNSGGLSPRRLPHQRTPSKSIGLGLMLLVAQAWVIHDPSRTGYLDKSRIVPFFATLPDELNASFYPAEFRIPSLLARSRSMTEPSSHGIDLLKLARHLDTLDSEQIRRRQRKYNYLFWDATLLSQADPKGIPFNHMSVLLSHYGTTDDVEPLDLAKVLGVSSSGFTVEECVRMDRMWGLLRMLRCRKQFQESREQTKAQSSTRDEVVGE